MQLTNSKSNFYLKIIYILENTTISENQAKNILNQFSSAKFHEFALIASINNKRGLQVLTNTKLLNNSMRYERKVKSLDQLFYDKGVNQELRLWVSHEPPFAYVSNDGNYSGMVKKYVEILCDMNNNTCEIISKDPPNEKRKPADLILSYGLSQINYFKTKKFEFSYHLEFKRFCILVPKGKFLNTLWDLMPVVPLIFKICVPIGAILCGMYWYYIVKGTASERNLYDIYFLMYAMFITNGLYKSPKLTTERIFCVFFILVSMFFICGYISKLTSLLVAPKYENEIDSIKELESRKIKVIYPFEYGYSLLLSYLNESFNKYFISNRQYSEQFLKLNRDGIILKLSQNKSLSQMVDCQIAERFIKSNANFKNRIPQYHIVKEQIVLDLNSFYAHFRSPFMKHVNLLNGKLSESGIWQKWFRDTDFDKDVNDKGSREAVIEENDILSAETVLEFGKILLIGYGLALCAFFVELVYFKFQELRSKINGTYKHNITYYHY